MFGRDGVRALESVAYLDSATASRKVVYMCTHVDVPSARSLPEPVCLIVRPEAAVQETELVGASSLF
jgi:hypothetical protein